MLFWNSTTTTGVAKMKIDFLDANNVVLQSVTRTSVNTTQPQNFNVDVTSTPSAVLGRLFKVRIFLGTGVTNSQLIFFNITDRTFDLTGGFSLGAGTFDLAPEQTTIDVQQRFTHAFSWTVPAPLNWHDLEDIRFRILDGSDVVLSLYFDEASRTFALFDEATGKFSQAYEAGENQRLQTPNATVFVRDCAVVADGPTSPTVTLYLNMSLKQQLSGRRLAVEVAASDDLGNHEPFVDAGTIDVR
jgi:hypothetical protein